jgi:hypothetical protein
MRAPDSARVRLDMAGRRATNLARVRLDAGRQLCAQTCA